MTTALSNNEVLLRFRTSTHFTASVLPKFGYGTVHSLQESPQMINLIRKVPQYI